MKKNGLLRDFTTLAGGNVVAQVIALAAYFVLTRIFTPDDFGLFNIFFSYIEVLIILSTCKYELAPVVAQSDDEARAVAAFALRLNTLVSLLLLAVATVLWLSHSLPARYDALGWMVLLIPPMVFFSGTSRVYAGLFNRMKSYRVMAASETTNAATAALLKALLGLLGMTQSGMPIGTVAGRGLANLCYRLKMRQAGIVLRATAAERRAAARRHANFPRYVATKDFVNSLSSALPFLWLGVHFDHAEVGLFGLALTFTFRPVNILNVAIERVLYSHCAEAMRAGQPVGHLVRRFLLVANAVALPCCAVAWLVAEPVMVFCFGSRWAGIGVYVQALLPWVYVMLSSTSLMFIPNLFGTQRTEFGFYLLLLALRVAAVAVGLWQGSFLLGVRLFAAAGAAVALALLVWYVAQVRRYDHQILTRK